MIAKANAMNSTAFARGRTLAGYGGTAAVPRDADRVIRRRRPGISHPGRQVAGPGRAGRGGRLAQGHGPTSVRPAKPGPAPALGGPPLLNGGLITFDGRHSSLSPLHGRC